MQTINVTQPGVASKLTAFLLDGHKPFSVEVKSSNHWVVRTEAASGSEIVNWAESEGLNVRQDVYLDLIELWES